MLINIDVNGSYLSVLINIEVNGSYVRMLTNIDENGSYTRTTIAFQMSSVTRVKVGLV